MAVELHTNLPLISAGDCSVCRDDGDVVFVRKLASDELFFVCPDCGCAWPEPPTPAVVDTVDPPEALAPQGWMIAMRTDPDGEPVGVGEEAARQQVRGVRQRRAGHAKAGPCTPSWWLLHRAAREHGWSRST